MQTNERPFPLVLEACFNQVPDYVEGKQKLGESLKEVIQMSEMFPPEVSQLKWTLLMEVIVDFGSLVESLALGKGGWEEKVRRILSGREDYRANLPDRLVLTDNIN